MALKGDLSTTGLSEVFQMLSMSQKEGTLVVEDGSSRKSIHFSPQGVRVVSAGQRKAAMLGEMLLRRGWITEAQLDEVLHATRRSGRKLGEMLVESGYVGADTVRLVVREQIEEEIYDLFQWSSARFEFIEGPPDASRGPLDPGAMELTLDVNALLLEAMRRADAWEAIRRQIPSLECILSFVSVDAREEEGRAEDPAQRAVARLIDGHRSAAEVVEASGLPKFEVCRRLAELVEGGRIRPLNVTQVLSRARALAALSDPSKGLRLYRAAAAQAPEDPRVIEDAGRALESHDCAPEAASLYAKAGRVLARRGDVARGLQLLERARALRPRDPEALLGTLEVLLADGQMLKAKDFARPLIGEALREGEPLLSRALCDRLAAADPADLEFRVLRARTLHQANQPKDLQEELLYIHQHLPSNPAEAERIRNELPETKLRIPKPPSRPAPPGRRRRGPLVAAAAALLLLAVAGYAAKRETDARAALDRVLAAARQDLDAQAWPDARRRIDEFRAGPHRHAFTTRRRADDFLREIDAHERAAPAAGPKDPPRPPEDRSGDEALAGIRAELGPATTRALARARALAEEAETKGDADLASRARALAVEAERRIEEAARLRRDADAHVREGRYAEAVETLDRLLTQYPNSEAAADARYPLAVTTRPAGVDVVDDRSGEHLGRTSEGPLLLQLAPAETLRLRFERPGYAVPPPREIGRRDAGALRVELSEKLPAWTWTAGRTLTGDPAVAGDLVVVAASTLLHALKLEARGEPAWTEALDGIVTGSPRASNGRIYAATSGGGLYAIDPGAKPRVRRCELGARASGEPGLTPDGSLLLVGSGDRLLHGVDARTLERRWTHPLPAEARGAPVAAGPLVLVGCEDGALLALEAGSRRELWKVQAREAFGPLCLADGLLIVASPDPFLYGVDAASGRPRWPRQALARRIRGRLLPAGAFVYGGDDDGVMHRFDAAGGRPAGSFGSGAAIRGGGAAAGPLILFGNDDGVLHALDASSFERRWTLRCPGPVRAAPAVAGSRAYVCAGDSLVAVDLD